MSELQLNNSSDDVDRLSELPQPILLHILSFLPTKFAIRVSAVSQHYRHLWTASPSIDLDRSDFPRRRAFTVSTSRCFRLRDRSAPLVRFSLKSDKRLGLKSIGSGKNIPLKSASNWLRRAYALGLRDLNLEICSDDIEHLLPLILTFHTLQSLKITSVYWFSLQPMIPNNFCATALRSLHLTRISCSEASNLKHFVMEQSQLEYLHLELFMNFPVDLVSQTVKRAKLSFETSKPEISLFFPALEVLEWTIHFCLDTKTFKVVMPLLRKANFIIPQLSEKDVPALSDMLRCVENVSELTIHIKKAYLWRPQPSPLRCHCSKKDKRMQIDKTYLRCCEMLSALPKLEWLELSCSAYLIGLFQVEMPLLRKADIMIYDAREDFVLSMSRLLKCVQNVVNLRLSIRDHENQLRPFHIFEPNTLPPLFPHLVKLELYSCLHEAVIEDVIGLLGNSPVLHCLKMNHRDPCTYGNQHKKKTYWQSKLPQNSEGNFQHACFTDLNVRDEKGQVIKLLSRRLTSKKRKM